LLDIEAGRRKNQPDSGSSVMASDDQQAARAKEMIERTCRELDQLQKDIQSTRATIDRSRKLLSQTGPTSVTD